MLTLYVGRVVKIDRHPRDPAAACRLARIVAVGPTVVLAKGTVGVEVLELDRPWSTWLNEGDLIPLSDRQEELRAKHGLPTEFAEACYAALGEISIDEAREAIRKYSREFNDA